MRTSRVSRQTAQLVDALSPRRATSSRRSGAIKIGRLGAVKYEHDRDVEPESPEAPVPSTTDRNERYSADLDGRKRKRSPSLEQAASTPKTVTEEYESSLIRVSPRKVSTQTKPKKARRQPAKQSVGVNGDIKMEPPPHWEEVYRLTKDMRSQILAPVDTMGCESLAEDKRSPRDRRFQTLVALMLSSQTKDTVTAAAIKNLQENVPGGLTLEAVLDIDPPTLNDLIGKVGFHNNKTRFIKAAALILVEQHKSDIPDTIEGLCALPGVGPKMAYLCMSAAWGRDEGIGVDVHVHRITNLWGWHKTRTPEETRAMLESWLPRDKWHDINHLLVGFGQTWCPPVGRRCDECKLAMNGLCPSAVVGKAVTKRVKHKEIKIEDGAQHKIITDEIDVKVEPIEAEQLHDEKNIGGVSPAQDMEDIGQQRRTSRRLAR